MKIGLVNVNFRSEGPEVLVGYMPPLPLLCIGGPLIDAGFTDITLIDSAISDLNTEQIVKSIIEHKFVIVFLSAMASTAATPEILKIAKKVKEINPNIYIVLGGVHATFLYKEIMLNNKYVDFIGIGEGEQLCVDLVTALKNSGDLRKIHGLVYRKKEIYLLMRTINI